MKKYNIYNRFVKFDFYIDDGVDISIDALKNYLEPYIYIDDNCCETKESDLTIITLKESTEIVYKDKKVITKFTDNLSLKRLIIDLVNRIIEVNTGIFFHSSSVVFNDNSYIFIGDKGQGKTTTMLNLLSNQVTSYSSNERTALIKENDVLLSYGNPARINIRVNTLRQNKQLYDKLIPVLDLEKYNHLVKQDLSLDCSERVDISYNDIRKYLEVDVKPINKTAAIINLLYDPKYDFYLDEIDYEVIKPTLEKNIISGVYQDRLFLEQEIGNGIKPSIQILKDQNIKYYNLYKNNSIDCSKKLIKRLENE